MLQALKNHPFAIEAFFKQSVVLTFAYPKEALVPLLPGCLTPDSFDDKWGFVAIAMVQTRDLRPKGFPRALGSDFFLAGYRVFTRYTSSTGRRLRGLYILHSETNSRRMQVFGNMFTHYDYKTTDIALSKGRDGVTISSTKSSFKLRFRDRVTDAALPAGSPFTSWKQARRYAGPLPFTFTYQPKNNSVLIIEGVRSNWHPKPIEILEYEMNWLQTLDIGTPVLSSAFTVNNIPYYWKAGQLDRLQ